MSDAEHLYKTMILSVFVCYDVAWYGCGRVNSDVLESLQHTKEPNATLGLVPDLNNYFYLNTCVQTFTFRRCNDINFLKVNLVVTKRSFCLAGAMKCNGHPRHSKSKESFIKFSRDPVKTYSYSR